MISWMQLKEKGSGHYKSGKIEPIDLYKDGGILRNFAIGNIIKYAYRNRGNQQINVSDMEKIKHYVDMLIAISDEKGDE